MTKISQASLNRCTQIAAAIDEELRKDPRDRKPLYLRTPKPMQLKRELAAYKTHYRQDWKSTFWMIVHDDLSSRGRDHPLYGRCVEISWTMENATRNIAFEIVRTDEDAVEIFHEEQGVLNHDSFALTLPSDLDDNLAAQYILMESPDKMKLQMSSLTDATKEYLRNPDANDPTPLMNMLIRRGYTTEVRGNFLWIYRGV